MRKSFDDLANRVREYLGRDPLSGSLFVFRNKGGHLMKVLWYDAGGLTIYYKRLDEGTFDWPTRNAEGAEATAVEITRDQLLKLLSGLNVMK